jgi:hypothetical protein
VEAGVPADGHDSEKADCPGGVECLEEADHSGEVCDPPEAVDLEPDDAGESVVSRGADPDTDDSSAADPGLNESEGNDSGTDTPWADP